MICADHELARRLEDLICAEFRRLAEVGRGVFPDAASECVEVADGVALWLGEGSPVNLAVGLGMRGPVTMADLLRLEAFYQERGAAAIMSMCPLADPSLLLGLGDRGWQTSEFEHVLVRELDAPPEPELDAEVDVRVCLPEQRGTWGRVAALGFSDGEPPGQGHVELGKINGARDDVILVLAWVDGEPAGTGALVIDGGVGWLWGDSTLRQYRRRGIQQAIQRYRLQLAREAGCDLAVTEAAPGGASQRNMERLGFRIAYTHVEFVKACHGNA
jgi:GNAT superfamily N-acetyltransferase